MRLTPNASAFYSQKMTDDVYVGIGLYGNYGLGIDYGRWAGDRLIKQSTMAALTLSPSLGYKVNEFLSVGASANINYGFLTLTRSVDGGDEKDQDHDWAISYRLGLLVQLTEQTRAGITWNSDVDYSFDINGKARFPNLPNVEYNLPISARVKAPQQLMLSIVNDVNQQWSIMGDLGWQDWSQFGAPQVSVNGQSLNSSNRMKDTWHTAFGVQYRPVSEWKFNTGIAFDSSPYRDQNDVAMTLPTGDEWRFGVGAQYQITQNSNVGFAAEYLKMQSSKVSTPAPFKGRYDNPRVWFASVNYSYEF